MRDCDRLEGEKKRNPDDSFDTEFFIKKEHSQFPGHPPFLPQSRNQASKNLQSKNQATGVSPLYLILVWPFPPQSREVEKQN